MYPLEKLILILRLGFFLQSIHGQQILCELHSDPIQVTFNVDTKEVELFDATKYQNATTDIYPQTYLAKECKCKALYDGDSNHYCLILNNENACSIASQSQLKMQPQKGLSNVSCFRTTTIDGLKKFFWFPLVCLHVLMVLSLFTTRFGRMAKDFVLSKCSPDRNKQLVEREIERERAERNEMRERLDAKREETSLYLKTKTFFLDADSEDFKEDSNVPHDDRSKHSICSICTSEIRNGDKIGDLHCSHQFHIGCLKEWIIRRNSCPLCNASDIAKSKATLTASHSIV